MKVCDLMNKNVVAVKPEDSAEWAARLLERHDLGALPVCTDGKIRGMVTDRDIVVRCIAAECAPADTEVRELMTRGVATVAPEDDVRAAAHKMAKEQVRRLPVVERDGNVVGMLSLGDVAKMQSFNMEASAALCEICTKPRHGRGRG